MTCSKLHIVKVIIMLILCRVSCGQFCPCSLSSAVSFSLACCMAEGTFFRSGLLSSFLCRSSFAALVCLYATHILVVMLLLEWEDDVIATAAECHLGCESCCSRSDKAIELVSPIVQRQATTSRDFAYTVAQG